MGGSTIKGKKNFGGHRKRPLVTKHDETVDHMAVEKDDLKATITDNRFDSSLVMTDAQPNNAIVEPPAVAMLDSWSSMRYEIERVEIDVDTKQNTDSFLDFFDPDVAAKELGLLRQILETPLYYNASGPVFFGLGSFVFPGYAL